MSVALIVNSCKKFFSTTIPFLVESAKKTSIPISNIYVVVGECDGGDDGEEVGLPLNTFIPFEGYTLIFCKYANIDYNGAMFFSQTAVGVAELRKYTHFFYIHDTCTLLPQFWDNIMAFSGKCPQYIKLQRQYSKNIGMFNVEWFLANKTEFLSYLVNYDTSRFLEYKSGEFPNKKEIYDKFHNLPACANEDGLFIFDADHRPLGDFFGEAPVTVYAHNQYSNIKRVVVPYIFPGIIKFQTYAMAGEWKCDL